MREASRGTAVPRSAQLRHGDLPQRPTAVAVRCRSSSDHLPRHNSSVCPYLRSECLTSSVPSCGLASYAVTPHSAPSLCPYCDAELFPAARAGARPRTRPRSTYRRLRAAQRRAVARRHRRRARGAGRGARPRHRRPGRWRQPPRSAPRSRAPSAQSPRWQPAHRGSSTRSGWAQNEPSIQSGVSRGIGTGSMVTSPPSQSASRSGMREDRVVDRCDLGQVVGHQPHRGADARVVGKDHDRAACDTTQLADAALLLGVPVVQGDDRHRGIDAGVAQRQVPGASADRGDTMRRALRGHHIAGLDRDHVAVVGLIGAGAGADVDDHARVAERGVDERGEAWILATGAGVAHADLVIARPSAEGVMLGRLPLARPAWQRGLRRLHRRRIEVLEVVVQGGGTRGAPRRGAARVGRRDDAPGG